MMPAAIVVVVFITACLAHELAHLVVGWSVGWSFVRPASSRWSGFGIAMDMKGKPERLLAVVVAGPLASAALCLIGLVFTPGIYAWCFAVVNAAMLFVNLLPLPGSDGSQILKALR